MANINFHSTEEGTIKVLHHSTSSLIEIKVKNNEEDTVKSLWLDYAKYDDLTRCIQRLNEVYYTPTRDQFKQGFQFESNYILFSPDATTWIPITLDLEDEHQWFFSAYDEDAYPTEFRVKNSIL